MKTINDFIKELQAISEEKRELPLVIIATNGLLFEPQIKMLREQPFGSKVEKMVICYD